MTAVLQNSKKIKKLHKIFPEGISPAPAAVWFFMAVSRANARWADIPAYLELVEQELSQIEGNIVVPVDPFYYWDLEEYDVSVLPSCFDGYNKLLGRTDMEKINYICLYVPRLLDGENLTVSSRSHCFIFGFSNAAIFKVLMTMPLFEEIF